MQEYNLNTCRGRERTMPGVTQRDEREASRIRPQNKARSSGRLRGQGRVSNGRDYDCVLVKGSPRYYTFAWAPLRHNHPSRPPNTAPRELRKKIGEVTSGKRQLHSGHQRPGSSGGRYDAVYLVNVTTTAPSSHPASTSVSLPSSTLKSSTIFPRTLKYPLPFPILLKCPLTFPNPLKRPLIFLQSTSISQPIQKPTHFSLPDQSNAHFPQSDQKSPSTFPSPLKSSLTFPSPLKSPLTSPSPLKRTLTFS